MRAEYTTARDRASRPWTVWAFGAIQLAGVATSFVVYDLDMSSRVASILLDLAIFVGLLKGARLAWSVALFFLGIRVLGSAQLVSRIVQDEGENTPLDVLQILLVALALIVLLHPRTRAWTSPR